jgi:hypothetical protein
LVDLWWTDAKTQKGFQCSKCPEQKKRKMRCGEPGFVNVPEPVLKRLSANGQHGYWPVDDYSRKYMFCPGKATWFPEMAELFEQCRVAIETGHLPRPGALEDQNEMFVDVFPDFVERWQSRRYYRTWSDVVDYTPKVLEAIGKMISSMFGKKR